MRELFVFANKKSKEMNNNSSGSNNNDSNISSSSSGSISSNSSQIHKSHPLAYHMSRILDDEIAKSKSLKSNTSYNSSLNDLDINALTLS